MFDYFGEERSILEILLKENTVPREKHCVADKIIPTENDVIDIIYLSLDKLDMDHSRFDEIDSHPFFAWEIIGIFKEFVAVTKEKRKYPGNRCKIILKIAAYLLGRESYAKFEETITDESVVNGLMYAYGDDFDISRECLKEALVQFRKRFKINERNMYYKNGTVRKLSYILNFDYRDSTILFEIAEKFLAVRDSKTADDEVWQNVIKSIIDFETYKKVFERLPIMSKYDLVDILDFINQFPPEQAENIEDLDELIFLARNYDKFTEKVLEDVNAYLKEKQVVYVPRGNMNTEEELDVFDVIVDIAVKYLNDHDLMYAEEEFDD